MMLVAIVTMAVLVVASVVWLGWQTIAGGGADASTLSQGTGSPRDAIASAPMASVEQVDAYEAQPSLTQADDFEVPLATVTRGPAGVPTGYPHTPAGAVGQLAAIEQSVLENMDLSHAQDVHDQWVSQGGPSYSTWSLTKHTQSFLGASGDPGSAKGPTTVVEMTPAGAMVKGTDGPDWVLSCVLMDVTVSIKTTSRMGFGYCARMAWVGTRWMIAEGSEPARAPSTWPGSVAAVKAGWLTWKDGE